MLMIKFKFHQNVFSVGQLSLMDDSKTEIKSIDIHIGDKGGVTVDGVLSETTEEIKFFG